MCENTRCRVRLRLSFLNTVPTRSPLNTFADFFRMHLPTIVFLRSCDTMSGLRTTKFLLCSPPFLTHNHVALTHNHVLHPLYR
jgi:hypothetical protein